MAQTTPPPIDPVPTPAPQRGDRATFSNRVDAFILWLVNAVTQFAAVATNVYNNAVDAFNSATAASTARTGAETARTGAETARTDAQTARTGAETARTGAETARDAAQNYAAALTATSTSSVLLGTGAKTFTTQAGKQFTVGARLYIVNPADATQFVSGPVTAYSGTTLTIEADVFGGSGTVSNWNISLSGARGVQGLTGGVTGGALTGGLWEKKGADLASAGTIDPWSGGGNFLPLIGVATITTIAPAPQAGAEVTLLATSAATITASANIIIKGVPSGQPYTLSPGDELDVRAETTTTFRVTVRRGDGTAIAATGGALHNLRVFEASGTYTASRTGWHKITCIGASGSSGIAAAYNGASPNATGAGAGGLCVGMRYLVAGQSYIVTVGSGGAAPAALTAIFTNGSVLAANGNSGGATSFSGAGIATMTANGGEGGKGLAGGAGNGMPLAGGVGGTASGGDFNVKGGDGGTITGSANRSPVATGGGAVGLRGAGHNGGNAVSTAVGTVVASGGAGVGGKGGDANSSGPASTAGGGAGGAASGATAGVNYKGVAGGPAATTTAPNDLDLATGGGNMTSANTDAAPGGGSAGGTNTAVYKGGTFAGGGGKATIDVAATAPAGGQYGGAPGGAALVVTSGSATATAATGSNGAVFIEF